MPGARHSRRQAHSIPPDLGPRGRPELARPPLINADDAVLPQSSVTPAQEFWPSDSETGATCRGRWPPNRTTCHSGTLLSPAEERDHPIGFRAAPPTRLRRFLGGLRSRVRPGVLRHHGTTGRSGDTSAPPARPRRAGTGIQQTMEGRDGDDGSLGHGTTRTRSVNATEPFGLLEAGDPRVGDRNAASE